MAFRVRQHQDGVADVLQVAGFRDLLAGDIRQVARAEVGVEPQLEDERARQIGGGGGLQRVQRGRFAEPCERRFAVRHVLIEVGLIAILVLGEVEVCGCLLQLELPDIRFGIKAGAEQRQQCVVSREYLGLNLGLAALGAGLLLDLRRAP